MKTLNDFSTRKLSKMIYQTNIMPSGNNTSFLKLSDHLIKRLQDGADLEKINRIISSELNSAYGLDVSKKQSRELSEEIYSWFHN